MVNDNAACPLCEATAAEPYGAAADFVLLRCGRCDLVYKTPRPDVAALAADLNAGYFAGRDEDAYIAGRRPVFRGLLNRLARRLPAGARLLDVGCARGVLLIEAAALGFDAFGLDLSWGELAAARRLGARRVALGYLEKAPFRAGVFDAVTLFDFVEHALFPAAALRAAADLLLDGGVVAFFTGNVRSRRARRAGMAWDYFYRPGHLNFFSERSIGWMLAAAGLRLVERQYSLVDVAAEKRLARLGLPTGRLRELFNKQLLPLKKIVKATAGKALGGEGIFVIATK